MDKATLEALEGSILKWWRIAYSDGVDEGVANCPLCRMFHWNSETGLLLTNACEGCPVAWHTSKINCEGTPYEEYAAWIDVHRDRNHPAAIAAAEKEFNFLVTLLPPNRTWTSPDGWEWYWR